MAERAVDVKPLKTFLRGENEATEYVRKPQPVRCIS
jgi:hypothetical protein